jgi:RimJ/RimL family protein N-acetyltransferase
VTGHIPRPLGTPALGTEQGIAAADRITVRPLGADDAERLLGLGGRLSPQSRYQRFFTPLAALPQPLLNRLLAVDHNDQEALAALVDDQIVGVVRYARWPAEPGTADLAVIIADAWQRQSLARRLILDLSELAQARQIRLFTATTLADNRGITKLFHQLWPQTRGHYDDGLTSYRLPLPPVITTSP